MMFTSQWFWIKRPFTQYACLTCMTRWHLCTQTRPIRPSIRCLVYNLSWCLHLMIDCHDNFPEEPSHGINTVIYLCIYLSIYSDNSIISNRQSFYEAVLFFDQGCFWLSKVIKKIKTVQKKKTVPLKIFFLQMVLFVQYRNLCAVVHSWNQTNTSTG